MPPQQHDTKQSNRVGLSPVTNTSKLLKLLSDPQALCQVLANNSGPGNNLSSAGLAPIYLGSNIDQMLPGQMPSFS